MRFGDVCLDRVFGCILCCLLAWAMAGRAAAAEYQTEFGRKWQVVAWEDLPLNTSMWGNPDPETLVHVPVVTAVSKLKCNFATSEPFKARSPSGSIMTTIPVYPVGVWTKTGDHFPTGGWISDRLPSDRNADPNAWWNLPQYEATINQCANFLLTNEIRFGSPVFFLYGFVERNTHGQNALIITNVKFPNIYVGLASSLWDNVITDPKMMWLAKTLLSNYAGHWIDKHVCCASAPAPTH